jgi:hypothetical protein
LYSTCKLSFGFVIGGVVIGGFVIGGFVIGGFVGEQLHGASFFLGVNF